METPACSAKNSVDDLRKIDLNVATRDFTRSEPIASQHFGRVIFEEEWRYSRHRRIGSRTRLRFSVLVLVTQVMGGAMRPLRFGMAPSAAHAMLGHENCARNRRCTATLAVLIVMSMVFAVIIVAETAVAMLDFPAGKRRSAG